MEYFVENSFSGARLRIYKEIPTCEPKAVVHITHGMAEHAGRYAWFMDVLKRAGYENKQKANFSAKARLQTS